MSESEEKEQQDKASPIAVRLWKLAKSRKYEELESAWLAAVEQDPLNAEEMLSVLEVLTRREDVEQAESLLWYLLTAQVERAGPKDALATVRKAVGLIPESPMLREEAGALYPKAYPSFPSIETLAQMTVLRHETPLPEAIEQMEKFLALGPGTYVADAQRAGRVVGLHPEERTLSVAFADGEQAYDAASIAALSLLDPDDFRALSVFERGRLEQLASDDPAELVRLALKTFGRQLDFRKLKSYLSDIIPQGAWSRWWSNARSKIKRSPWIEASDGTQPTFSLRREAAKYEDRVRADFDAADSLQEKVLAVLDYVDQLDDDRPADAHLAKHLADELAQYVKAPAGAEPSSVVGALAAIARLCSTVPDLSEPSPSSLEEVLSTTDQPSDLLRPIQEDKVARCILAFIRDSLPEKWADLYAEVLPGASSDICEWIAQELTRHERHEALRAAAAKIMAQPDANAKALVWLWKAACAGQFPEAIGRVDRSAVLMSLLRVAHNLKRGGPPGTDDLKKDALGQIRSAISAKDYSLLRQVIEEAGSDRATEIWNAAEYNRGLSEYAQTEVFSAVRDAHPEHFAETVPLWEEDAIYTTRAGIEKRRQEYADLVNVRMAEVEKEIRTAIGFGDLSENAEYTAALEHRGRLAQKATMIQQEFSKAKLIAPPRAENVTVGSRVTARNLATGETETFVFLGPWDADLDKGIYSYLAPLSQAFMGKKKGEVVLLSASAEEKRWEILDIAPAI